MSSVCFFHVLYEDEHSRFFCDMRIIDITPAFACRFVVCFALTNGLPSNAGCAFPPFKLIRAVEEPEMNHESIGPENFVLLVC